MWKVGTGDGGRDPEDRYIVIPRGNGRFSRGMQAKTDASLISV
jgi:hypothetical protein